MPHSTIYQPKPRLFSYVLPLFFSITAMLALAGNANATDDDAIQQELIMQGKLIAQNGVNAVPPCMTCHGTRGEGLPVANYPYLAGQPAQYLSNQLTHFANDERKNPIMQPMAKGLSDEQRLAVSTYYESLPQVFDPQEASNVRPYYPIEDKGAWLALHGSEKPHIPACVNCHGPGGIGVQPIFPALTSQPEAFLREQLSLMKSGGRGEDTHKLMTHLAKQLTDEQIAQVSQYFAKQAAPSPSMATNIKPKTNDESNSLANDQSIGGGK